MEKVKPIQMERKDTKGYLENGFCLFGMGVG